jgi:hypothetical protein
MRRRLQTLSAVLAVVAMAPSAALAQAVAVPIDQGLRVSLPAGTQSVLIGNPEIADISVLDSHNAVIMGRTYGVTNLMVIDGRGRTLMDRQVVVSSPEVNRVTAYRGAYPSGAVGVHVENFACSPRCERTPMPGETQNDYQNYSAGYNDYEKRASEARKNGANTRADP